MSETTPNALDDDGKKVGLWSETDPHGGVMTGHYRDGRREGGWRHVAGDGRLRSEGTYDNGELHGSWTWYRASGGLLQKGSFDRGEKDGVWERWDARGQPLDETTWEKGRKKGARRGTHRPRSQAVVEECQC